MPKLDLSLKLQPKQSELLERCENSKAGIIGYGGSRGGGKSGAARRVMLLRRLANPGTTGVIFRRVYDDLKKNHIDKFFTEFPGLFRFYHSTDREIILPAQGDNPPSRIMFMYAETEAEIKRKFHGPEFMDIFVDQAEQLTEIELKYMKTCCRWPGTSRYQCKFVLYFNPGGIGISYFKRIFKDKEYFDKENPEDYSFIQAYGWDNVEWARSALIEEGLTEEDFYTWSNEKRFNYFIERTQYGQELNSLPQAMRIGHLMGSFDEFTGQYFDLWNPLVHTMPLQLMQIKPWHPKWISIDWGYNHPAAIYWWAQDGAITKTYREKVVSNVGPRALAQEIIDLCKLEEEPEKIDAIYISPDTKQKREVAHPIIKQMGDVLRKGGLPYPRVADDDRISGWRLMYDMLKEGRWVIGHNCPKLIGNLPLFSYDEEKPEDCVKFDGDDPGDSARYGLKSRFSSREAPREVQLHARITEMREELADKGRDLGEINTAIHLNHLKFEQNYAQKHRPLRIVRSRRARR